jgi:hypothetical protein
MLWEVCKSPARVYVAHLPSADEQCYLGGHVLSIPTREGEEQNIAVQAIK